MRIERVIARAFGPFRGETLDLAPGMTVVAGPNEAGKTSWHAATRMALTGVRRGKGRGTKIEEAIEARHRPWDLPEQWEVEARIALDDGRTIDISQDLAGKVACRAIDVALGRDVSDEILDGTPDASRWLGLDRDSFAATVCVGQAQIMAVASDESAELLQQHMQRAAATRGTDATAAEALRHLSDFRRSAVGADIATARGPLRAAKVRLADAEAALAEARRQHAAYLEHGEQVEVAERRVVEARRRLALVDAAIARHDAEEAAARAARGAELAARHPVRPPALTARDEQADAVATAIDAWQRRPQPVALVGATSSQLERDLAALPGSPEGDLRPHPSVTDALRALDLADEALRLVGEEPDATHPSVAPHATSLPAAGPLAAALLVIGAIAALVVGAPLVAGALLVSALAIGAWTWFADVERRGAAAQASAAAAVATQLAAGWDDRRAAATARVAEAEGALRDALAARGSAVDGTARQAFASYEAACAARAEQGTAAARRDSLAQALDARLVAERSGEDAERASADAESALREAAASIGLEEQAADPETLIAGLRAWQHRRSDELRANETAIAEWQELSALLGSGTLADLAADATRRRGLADRLAAEVGLPRDGDEIAAGQLEALRATLREEVEQAKEAADSLTGGLGYRERSLPDVAEAEEELTASTAELTRVESLAATLDLTARLLHAAEERVHRNLAPILAEAIGRWLPAVSKGAYVEASVDPADLSIRVKEERTGQWRDAKLLSEGTREQIYLLLRVAMAQHLVTTGETAPLLLDEVTAQSDSDRKLEFLSVLHELSAERQVILFSHDSDVAEWAARSLHEPQDLLVRLATPAGAPLAEVAVR
jgi:exonuclease SbcC